MKNWHDSNLARTGFFVCILLVSCIFSVPIINHCTPNASAAENSSFADGDLIRVTGTPDIYIVKTVGDKKFRRLILSPSVFKSYGHLKWENVKEVSYIAMGEYTESNLVCVGSGIRADVSCDIYRLASSGDSGWRELASTIDFTNKTYDIDSVYIINGTDFASYKDKTYNVYGIGDIPPTPEAQMEIMAYLNGFMITHKYGFHFGINCDRLAVIWRKVLVKEKGLPKTEMRDEFQRYLRESGISAAEAATAKDMILKTFRLERLVLIDTSWSLSTRNTLMSAEREKLQKELIASYPDMKPTINYINYTIGQAVAGKSVRIFERDYYLNYASVKKVDQEFDTNLEARLGQLF